MSNRQIPVPSRFIELTPIVTKFFAIGITGYIYKIGPQEQKLSVIIYLKTDIEAANTIRFDISISKRYIDIFDISKHHQWKHGRVQCICRLSKNNTTSTLSESDAVFHSS